MLVWKGSTLQKTTQLGNAPPACSSGTECIKLIRSAFDPDRLPVARGPG
jgi:hypothetical protein